MEKKKLGALDPRLCTGNLGGNREGSKSKGGGLDEASGERDGGTYSPTRARAHWLMNPAAEADRGGGRRGQQVGSREMRR